MCVNCYARFVRKQNPEAYKAIDKKYNESEHGKKRRKELNSTPERKEYVRKKVGVYRSKNKELCLERTRKWRSKNGEYLANYNKSRKITKLLREYGEDAARIMLENDKKCQKCGSTKRVALHHVDWDDTNNVYENFAVLCGSCHSRLHNWVPPRFRREIFEEFMVTPNDELR
jgi:5-methylcytosine-specific restriction endonuclease McrA